MKRDTSRPALSHSRIVGKRPTHAPRQHAGDRSGGFVALALVLLIAVVFALMLSDGRVAENLGEALRYWSGVRE